MSNPFETITHPWREPKDYLSLVFWFIIFLIVAGAMYDGMRILGSWIKASAA